MLFIQLFKKAGLRLSNKCNNLNKADEYYHFGRRKKDMTIYDLLKMSVDMNIIGESIQLKNESGVSIFLNKLK